MGPTQLRLRFVVTEPSVIFAIKRTCTVLPLNHLEESFISSFAAPRDRRRRALRPDRRRREDTGREWRATVRR